MPLEWLPTNMIAQGRTGISWDNSGSDREKTERESRRPTSMEEFGGYSSEGSKLTEDTA